jgi:hypothetical protein
MQLLQDVFIVENLQILTEGKTNPTVKVRGVFGRCNEENRNGRTYPTKVMEGQITKVQPLIEERRLCGELDHPQNDTVKLSNASHLVTKLEMKGDELIGEAEILNTPAGLTAKALIEGGVRVGISSRGMGTLSEDADGKKVVNDDFRLVTFDLVADPSTRGAFPGLSESTESKFVQESQDKLKKESNFITMIEARLRDSYTPFLEEATKSKPLKGGQKKLDRNKNGRLDSQDFKMLRNESMEAVKEEGSWHKIAFALAEAMGLTPEQMKNKRYHDQAMKDPKSSLSQKKKAEVALQKKIALQKKNTSEKMDEDYTMSKSQRETAYRASVRQAERGPQGGRARRDRKALLQQSTSYQQIGDLMAEALGLVEAYNRKERLKMRNDELAERDEEYRRRVKKYPSSTGNPKTRMKLNKQGRPVSGRRRTDFKPS